MKKSLKMSMQIFGVAGLVLLAGCASDAPEVVPTDLGRGAPIEELQKDVATGMEKTAEIADETTQIVNDAMEKVSDVTTATDGEVEIAMAYDSPGGAHTMTATMTVKDGIVIAGAATPEVGVTNRDVKKWQGTFVENFSQEVVGKKFSELSNLDAIGGASLTMGGFQEALASL